MYMQLYRADEATASTADSNPPSSIIDERGSSGRSTSTTAVTALTADPSSSAESDGCLVATHPKLCRNCEVLLRNDLTTNQKLDLVLQFSIPHLNFQRQ